MVGEILRKRREELGKDLREIANILKIRSDYLKAIEDEAFEKLPVEVYIRGYIREYARVLNLDPETVLKAYIQQRTPAQSEKKEVPEQEIMESIGDSLRRKRLKLRHLLISSLLILSAIILAFIISPSTHKKLKMPSHTPLTKKEDVSTLKNAPHILEVYATETTWLRVDIDKTRTKEILLRPGESVKWHAEQGFSLKIGNAGGIKLIFDGKEIGRPGEKGQVIRLTLP